MRGNHAPGTKALVRVAVDAADAGVLSHRPMGLLVALDLLPRTVREVQRRAGGPRHNRQRSSVQLNRCSNVPSLYIHTTARLRHTH